MSVKFSQFNSETLLLNTDIAVGLRAGINAQFPIVGIGDSLGAKLITWTQGATPNVNYIDFQNNITGTAPILSAKGSDVDVNLSIAAQGAGHVGFAGTGAIAVPYGTTGQQPVGFGGGFRYNTDTNFMEYWDLGASVWTDIFNGSVNEIVATLPLTATTTLGVTTIALTTPLAEIYGGTHQSSYVLGDTLYASAANTLSKLAGNTTTTKEYLSQTGTGSVSAAPAWSAISGGDITGAALTEVNDTNVTLTLGGTPATALLRAASITAGWTGQLATSRGGTGLASFAANEILYASSSSVIGQITTTNNSILATNGTGIPAFTTTMPTAVQLSVSNYNSGSGASSTTYLNGSGTWTTPPGTGVATLTGTANQIDVSASTGPVVLSLDSTLIAPGTFQVGDLFMSGETISGSLGINISAPDGVALACGSSAQISITGTGITVPLAFYNAAQTFAVSFQAATSFAANVNWTLPSADSNGVWISNGAGTLSITKTLPSAIALGTPASGTLTNCNGYEALRSFQIFKTGTAATYTKPSNISAILVEAIGGGGGSGSATCSAVQLGASGGGGGGSYSRKYYASPAATYTYTVGAGGSAGGAGGSTTFDVITAGGGSTSPNVTGTTSGAIALGGAGGTASGGDVNMSGYPGTSGVGIVNSGVASGNGGGTVLSGGTPGSGGVANAGAANTGSGASGAGNNSGNNTLAGAAGGSGLIIVWEFG